MNVMSVNPLATVLKSLAFSLLVLASAALWPASAEAKHPAVRYMERVATELVKAGRLSSRSAFYKSILRHADTRHIGTYSLGIYLPRLKNSKKKSYYEGVRRFVARYFATQSRKYHVSKVQILSKARKSGRAVLVDSKIHLSSGTKYTVVWKLRPTRNGYQIQDARVLGFWLTPFLRSAFVNYVKKNGGNIDKLIVALKR
ncbi:MAG: ABC transporter substrate-binding protein [Pseudomonadota bacterium]